MFYIHHYNLNKNGDNKYDSLEYQAQLIIAISIFKISESRWKFGLNTKFWCAKEPPIDEVSGWEQFRPFVGAG